MSLAKYAVAISGGVDSAVAAYLTKSQNPNTIAIFMKNWPDDGGSCNVESELALAKSIANKLELELHVVNFSEEYQAEVFQEFLDDYAAGLTPNPDILCNKNIKFKHLLHKAKSLGAEYLVTGHYARIQKTETSICLQAAIDPKKDQSYFLASLSPNQLACASFPLGNMQKTEVRKLAKEIGLPNHAKKDSTGICFIEPKHFQDFLRSYILAKPGLMLDEHGKTIGQHQGLPFYTIGQRSGLNIGGVKGSNGEPWYVYGKDLTNNSLLLVQGKNHPLLFKHKMQIGPISYTSNDLNDVSKLNNLRVRIRHLGAIYDCQVINNEVIFKTAVRAVTPGQYAVFYHDELCLGAAKILA